MRRFLTLITVLVLMSSWAGSGIASSLNRGVQGITYERLFPGAVFDEAIPTQKEITGVAPGERPLRVDEVLAYFTALAESSDRAALNIYARSYEGRPLVYLMVGDAQVIARADDFQIEHKALMDPRTDSAVDAESLAGTRAVAWVAYGIHGDELSSSDAAAAVAYRLVAGIDPEAVRLRHKLLILIDPCENPDGRNRYLAQIGSFAHRRANPDQDDLSHSGVWPWGRGNHYLFDMNRDWFTQVLPESRRSSVIASWVPQLMVDSHEMGSNASYLFSPPRHPFNPHLPTSARSWEQPFSDDQARALDARGYPYFTGEWNEEFFPGYGSSWASYLGTVGILYEMSRTTGTLVHKRDGSVRTFAQAIEHHTTSTLANLTTLADHSAEVLADQIAARVAAVEAGRKGWLRAWIFPVDQRHRERTRHLAWLMTQLDLRYYVLGTPIEGASDLHDARTGEKVKRDLPIGSLMVPMDQPNSPLARVILDPHVPMDSEFFQDEREYLEKGKGSRLYETTAWSVPLAMGVPAYWTGKIPTGGWHSDCPSNWRPEHVLEPGFSSVIIDGDEDESQAVLVRLLEAGLVVRIARKPFTTAGHSWHRGAMVLRAEGNPEDLVSRLNEILEGKHIFFQAVTSAHAEEGPDLGGAEYPVLVAPRVAVLTGMPISTTDYGAVWHFLDNGLDLRFSGLDVGRFGRADLSRYNVLIFPGVMGGTATYRQAVGPAGMKKLEAWISAGGTAIGFGGGARLLADPVSDLTVTRFRADALEEFPPPVWSLTALEAEVAGRVTATGLRLDAPEKSSGSLYDVAPVLGPGALPFTRGFDQGKSLTAKPISMTDWVKPILQEGKSKPDIGDLKQADDRLRRFMPQGALLAVDLDPELWLNFGLADQITVWFGGGDTMVAAPPVSVAARFPTVENMQQGGLLWPEAAARMAMTAYAVREGHGRGQVILFAAPPVYRRWMLDSERMFTNAILLGPGLGTHWSSPW